MRALSCLSLYAVFLLSTPSFAAPEVKLSGFVDSSLSFRPTSSEEGLLLALDQVELDIAVSLDRLALRIDLQYFPTTLHDPSTGPVATFDELVEQGFAEFFFTTPERGLYLRAGKWNAPVGFETVDPTGLWQSTHGLLFSLTDPSNLTGVAFGWNGPSTRAELWVSNDWDAPGSPKDTHLGGRLQQTLGEVGTLGLSTTFGALSEANPRLMLDLDGALSFKPLRLGFEVNFGLRGDLTSLGFLLSANVALSDKISVTGRFDWLDREFDTAYTGSSLTLAGLFNLAQGFDILLEARADFQDGADTELLTILEALASF
jgi:hypothetical protein